MTIPGDTVGGSHLPQAVYPHDVAPLPHGQLTGLDVDLNDCLTPALTLDYDKSPLEEFFPPPLTPADVTEPHNGFPQVSQPPSTTPGAKHDIISSPSGTNFLLPTPRFPANTLHPLPANETPPPSLPRAKNVDLPLENDSSALKGSISTDPPADSLLFHGIPPAPDMPSLPIFDHYPRRTRRRGQKRPSSRRTASVSRYHTPSLPHTPVAEPSLVTAVADDSTSDDFSSLFGTSPTTPDIQGLPPLFEPSEHSNRGLGRSASSMPNLKAPMNPRYDHPVLALPDSGGTLFYAHSQPVSPLKPQGEFSFDVVNSQHDFAGPLRSPIRLRPPPSPYPPTPMTPLGPIHEDGIEPEDLKRSLQRRIEELEKPGANNTDEDLHRLGICLKSPKHRAMLIALGRSAPDLPQDKRSKNQRRGVENRGKTRAPQLKGKNAKEIVKCFVDKCGSTYTSVQNLFKHFDKHLKIKRVECPMCHATMAGDLPRHFRLVHDLCYECSTPLSGDNVSHQPDCSNR